MLDKQAHQEAHMLMMDGHPVVTSAFPKAPLSMGPSQLIIFSVGSFAFGALALTFISCMLDTSPDRAKQSFFPRYMKLSLWMRLSQLGVGCFTTLAVVCYSMYHPTEGQAQNGTSADLCFGYRPVDGSIVAWRAFGLLIGEVMVGVLVVTYNSTGRLFGLLFLACINLGVLAIGLNHIYDAEIQIKPDEHVILKVCIPFVSSYKQIFIGIISTLFFLAAIDVLLREGRRNKPLSIQSGDTEELLSNCDNTTDKSQYLWLVGYRTELCALVFVWLPAVFEFTLFLSGAFSLGDVMRWVMRTVFLCLCNVVIGITTWCCNCGNMTFKTSQKVKLIDLPK